MIPAYNSGAGRRSTSPCACGMNGRETRPLRSAFSGGQWPSLNPDHAKNCPLSPVRFLPGQARLVPTFTPHSSFFVLLSLCGGASRTPPPTSLSCCLSPVPYCLTLSTLHCPLSTDHQPLTTDHSKKPPQHPTDAAVVFCSPVFVLRLLSLFPSCARRSGRRHRRRRRR